MGSALINRLSNWMPLLFAHKWIIKWTKKTSERRSIRQSISESVEGRMVDVTSTEHKSWFHIHSEPGLETSPRNVPQMFVGLWALEAPPMSDWQTLSFFFTLNFSVEWPVARCYSGAGVWCGDDRLPGSIQRSEFCCFPPGKLHSIIA